MQRIIFFLVTAMLAVPACAQSDRETYMNAILELCPDADFVEFEFKEDYTEVEYWCEGKLVEAGINKYKEIVYTESETQIPGRVQNEIHEKLDKRYYGWVLDEYARVNMQDTSFYKVEILRSGVEENVYFTIDGKYYKPGSVDLGDDLNRELLLQWNHFEQTTYDFLNPDQTYYLPEVLKELSGIAVAGEDRLFCVQDELGIVFQFNLDTGEIDGMIRFTDKGDFEDVAVRGDTVYVLRSDGTIFYFGHRNFDGQYHNAVVQMSCMDVEGLHFDANSEKFIISCKDQSINTYGSQRSVYQFTSLGGGYPDIDLYVDLDEINAYLSNHFPGLTREKLQFNPSAVAIDPVTGEKYVLSASGRMIAIYAGDQLLEVYPLPADLYYKPEGIDFTPGGDLLIASEGIKKGFLDGQIHRFSARKLQRSD